MIRRGQISELDCRTAESMVARYMNHTLKTDEMEEFLDHIEHCPSCYDELETYFIVNKVTQQLDEQEDGSVLDFQKLLEQDIRRVLAGPAPCVCQVFVTKQQKTEPKLASRQLPDGTMVSASLEDMYPFLSREELEENMVRKKDE